MEAVTVTVDPAQTGLYIDCRVRRAQGEGRAVLEREHTRLRRLEADGVLVGGDAATEGTLEPSSLRAEVAALSFAEMIAMAQGMEPQDRALLRQGAAMNAAMGQHGLSLLPPSFVQGAATDPLTRITRLVSAGVLARMSGEPLTVMSLAGSGNKGITVSIPLTLWGREQAHPQERVEEALGLACLVTSATTHHLGTLSAVCGCSNAAGIGIAAALVFLDGGGPGQVDLAVNNMVGNVAGMICDGAKMGCAMKTMTGVDAAFRSATLALAGIGIPASDGIVGVDGVASLAHLGRLAQRGMAEVDKEILAIMQGKLRPAAPELIR
jgi:L-cysteine desulfidase